MESNSSLTRVVVDGYLLLLSKIGVLLTEIPEGHRKDEIRKELNAMKADLSDKMRLHQQRCEEQSQNLKKAEEILESSMTELNNTFSDLSMKIHALKDESELVNKNDSKIVTQGNSIESKMLKYVREWQRNLEIREPGEYTDEMFHCYLLKIAGESFPNDNSHENMSIDELIQFIPREKIVETLHGDMIVEPLKFNEKNMDPNLIVSVKILTGETPFTFESLLSSKKFRNHLFQGGAPNEFSIPLELPRMENVKIALQNLMNGKCDDYFDNLNSIEDFGHFVRLFEYLQLEFID